MLGLFVRTRVCTSKCTVLCMYANALWCACVCVRALAWEGRHVGVDALCKVCNDGEGDERMLLCEACDVGYHYDCLEPPLKGKCTVHFLSRMFACKRPVLTCR